MVVSIFCLPIQGQTEGPFVTQLCMMPRSLRSHAKPFTDLCGRHRKYALVRCYFLKFTFCITVYLLQAPLIWSPFIHSIYIVLCCKQLISQLSSHLHHGFWSYTHLFKRSLRDSADERFRPPPGRKWLRKLVVHSILSGCENYHNIQNNSVFVLDIFFYSSSKSGCTMQAKCTLRSTEYVLAVYIPTSLAFWRH